MIKKNKLKDIAGITLIEIMIGVVISAIMMGAMYTTYSIVNSSYTQVTDRAKISRSGRDIIAMLIRDIRLAGFKYHYGVNTDDISKILLRIRFEKSSKLSVQFTHRSH